MSKCLAMLALLLLALPASSATIHVPADQPTIQAGIDAGELGDTILIDCGIYYEHDIVLRPGLTVRGLGGDPDCVTVDADGLGRVFFAENLDSLVRLEGLTLRGGSEQGGAIRSAYSEFDVSHCVITENYSSIAAGIYMYDSEFRITGCVFRDNEGTWGGGGIQIGDSSPLIQDCLFEGNYASDGGAIFNRLGGSPLIEDCLFVGNGAGFWGGAFFTDGIDADPVIRNCTFVGNWAEWTGGAIWVAHDTLLVENSIVAFSTEGGGIYNASAEGGDPMILTHCNNVFGNAEGNYAGGMEDQTGINGNISSHPLFCDMDAGDYSLAFGSPCLPENNGCGVLMGAFGLGCDHPTGTEETPATTAKIAVYPNPFNPSTSIRFVLDAPGPVHLAVYDMSGRLVRELHTGTILDAGEQVCTWDGRDAAGVHLASGVYFLRADFDGIEQFEKVVLLK